MSKNRLLKRIKKYSFPHANFIRAEQTLLLLVLAFLPTQLGKHFWPDFAYIYSLKVDYLSPTIYFWDILVCLLLLVWVARFIFASTKPNFFRYAPLVLLIFFITQVLSLSNALNVEASVVRLGQLELAGLFGLYIANQKFDRKFRGVLKDALTIGLFFEGSLAALQFLLGRSLGLWVLGERLFNITTPSIATFNWYGQVFLRPYGTFPHPNVLAGFMLVVTPLLFYLYKPFLKEHPFNRTLLNSALFLGFFTVFLTFSRAAILVGLFEMTLIFKQMNVFEGKRIDFKSRKAKVVGALLFLSLPFIFTRFSSAFNFDYLSIQRREDLAVSAWQMFKENPLSGVGVNNFIVQMSISELVAGPSRFLQPVHNILLLILAESGLLGLSGWLGLLGYPVVRAFRNFQLGYNKLVLALFGVILFLGMFDHYFLTLPQGQRLLFLVWGLSMLEYPGGDS